MRIEIDTSEVNKTIDKLKELIQLIREKPESAPDDQLAESITRTIAEQLDHLPQAPL